MSNKTTKQYKVLNPIAYSGRVERGEVVSLTDEEAANFGADYVTPYVSATDSSTDEVEEKAVEKMTVAELRIKAAELGLSDEGSKADLVERINLHLANEA